MKQFYLAEVITKDKLVHQGIYFQPSRKNKKSILWVHGLTDNFYGDLHLMEELSSRCETEGWGLAAFNNRGHDIVSSITKLDPSLPKGKIGINGGSAYEAFEDCILDIDAGISFLVSQGFPEIVIAGISTGANKVCYYAGTQRDPRVAGVILSSPLSDVPIGKKELGKNYRPLIQKAETRVRNGKGNDIFLDYPAMMLTANRFLSLYREGSEEDVFPYYQKNPKSKVFTKIAIPLFVVLAGSDEYSDRPVSEIKQFFDAHQRSIRYHSVVIAGAFHSYGGKEKECADAMHSWMLRLSAN